MALLSRKHGASPPCWIPGRKELLGRRGCSSTEAGHSLLSSLPLLCSRWLKQPRASQELPITPQVSRSQQPWAGADGSPSQLPIHWEHLFQVLGFCSFLLCPYSLQGRCVDNRIRHWVIKNCTKGQAEGEMIENC